MLEVSQLSRRYGDFIAVDRVSFNIEKGEIVGLLGHNGAGKTTIMKMLSGYLEPDQGQIRIDGLDLVLETKKAQQRLGYLPENLPIYPEMTVADYLDYAATLKRLPTPDKSREIARVVNATDIGDKLLAPIALLSRGYKQRVGVAQAILGRPKLLILDEPTNGLDPTQTTHMRQLIRELSAEATVILSTHIMQEVEALCDRVLILHRGELAVDARLEALHRSNHLRLRTSMPESVAKEKLLNIAGIEELQGVDDSTDAEPGYFHYRLRVAPEKGLDPISAMLAKTIVAAEAELYSLQTEKKDLETLFREVSNVHTAAQRDKELNHAA